MEQIRRLFLFQMHLRGFWIPEHLENMAKLKRNDAAGRYVPVSFFRLFGPDKAPRVDAEFEINLV